MWSSATFRACLSDIKALQLGLSENEMIQIANLLPQTDVEYYLIVENNRLSEDQIGAIKDVIDKHSQITAS